MILHSDVRLNLQLARLSTYAEILAAGGDHEVEAAVLVRLAIVDAERGALGRALRHLRRGLRIAWPSSGSGDRAQGLLVMATILLRLRRHKAALACVEAAEELAVDEDPGDVLPGCWLVGGMVARAVGEIEQARSLLHAARDGFAERGRLGGAGQALLELAEVEVMAERPSLSLACLESARQFFAAAGLEDEAIEARARLAEQRLGAGDLAGGMEAYEAARADLVKLRRHDEAALLDIDTATLLVAAGDLAQARRVLGLLDEERLLHNAAGAAALFRRLAEAELDAGAAAEGLRLLERSLQMGMAARDESELSDTIEAWVARLAARTLPETGWRRIASLADQLDAAGMPRLAASCREAAGSLT